MTPQEINQVVCAVLKEKMHNPEEGYYLSSTYVETLQGATGTNGQILVKGASSIGIVRSGDEDIILDGTGVATLTSTNPTLTLNNDPNVIEVRDIPYKFGGGGSAPSLTIIRKYLTRVSYREFKARQESGGRR